MEKIRGERGNIILLDEYAKIPKNIIDVIIRPMRIVKTTYGDNQIIMASTAYYQFNHLYTTYTNFVNEINKGSDKYNLQEFTYKDTPNHIDLTALETDKLELPREIFLMEYENVFPRDGDGYYPMSLLRQSQTINCALETYGSKDGVYVLGVDPATRSDNFALVVIKISGKTNKVVKVVTIKNGSHPQMADCIRWHCEHFNVVRVCMDAGGGGYAIRDLLAEDSFFVDVNGNRKERELILMRDLNDPQSYPHRVGKRILDVVYSSGKEVNHMNSSLKSDLENQALVFPDLPTNGDSEQESLYEEVDKMIDEIASIRATVNSTNYLSFDTINSKARKDRYSALLFANKAAREVRYGDKTEEIKKELPMGFWTPTYF